MTPDKGLWLPPLAPKDQQRINQQRKRQQRKSIAEGFKGKTVWDWLQLLAVLLIPIVIASGTLWFTASQSQASDRASEKQHQTNLQIAQQQYQNNINLANDQQQETALQSYLDQMSNLLLNDNLRTSKPGDAVREVARSRTLTLLPQLNGTRKGEAVQFLYESGLINAGSDQVINLSGANLSGTILSEASLSNTDLSYVNLSGANLYATSLFGADLYGANLSGAILSEASLSKADLREANLSHADLDCADLSYVDLWNTDLSYADLGGIDNVTNEQLNEAVSLEGAKFGVVDCFAG